MNKLILCLCVLFSSCTGYKNHFDCPPGKGVGCLSMHQIERGVVEREQGEDIFMPGRKLSLPGNRCKSCRKDSVQVNAFQNGLIHEGKRFVYMKPKLVDRLWVNSVDTEIGNHIASHYVYFTLEEEKWEDIELTANLMKVLEGKK